MSKKKKRKKHAGVAPQSSVASYKKPAAGASACPACGEVRDLWWHGSRYACEPCLEKTQHPVERGPLTSLALFRGAFAIAREAGPKALFVTLVFSTPAAVFSAFGEANVSPDAAIAWVIGLSLVQGIGLPIAMSLGLRALDGEPLDLAASVRVGFTKYLPLLFAMVIQQLIVMVWSLLLIVPGVMRATSYALLAPLIVSDEAGALGALEESRHRMKGNRLRAFPALLVVWLPWIAGQMYLMTVGPLGPASGPARPDWAVQIDPYVTLALPVFDLAWLFTVLALHAKLRGEHRVRFDPKAE